jgi:hypothetical protein
MTKQDSLTLPAAVFVILSAFIIIFFPDIQSAAVSTKLVKPLKVEQNLAIDTILALPEVKRENTILNSLNTATTVYVERGPLPNDNYYYVYYGEVFSDHEARLEEFLVDAKTGEVSVYDIVNNRNLSYSEWQKTCQLQACTQK